MKKILLFISFVLILLALQPVTVIAAPTVDKASGSMSIIGTAIDGTIAKTVSTLQDMAILWLSSFIALQFLITNFGLMKSGADIEAVFGKFIGSLAWFGVCFYIVLHGPEFIKKVGNSFFSMATGLGISFDAGVLMDNGVKIGSGLIMTILEVAGWKDVGTIVIGGICGLFILLVMAFIAFKIFMIKIELALVVMISPMSFAFLGLNALKDQGIAPFKALISLFYRIMIIGILIYAVDNITANVNATLIKMNADGDADSIWPIMLSITVSYLIFGFLAFKSDSIAASLASGSTNLGTGDVASAAAMGAAAGAAIATGGATAAGAAATGGKSMGDVMKGMTGGAGSISNAGSGAAPSVPSPPPAPPSAPSLSSKAALDSHPASVLNQGGAPSGNGGASGRGTSSGGASTGGAQSADSVGTPGGDNFVGPVKPAEVASPASEASHVPPTGGVGTPGGDKFVGPMKPPEVAAPAAAAPPPVSGGGSGSSAGIGGAPGASDQKMDAILDALSKPEKKPSFGDQMGVLNDHVAKEQAATHVSINANAAD